jgi:hypothetical protein
MAKILVNKSNLRDSNWIWRYAKNANANCVISYTSYRITTRNTKKEAPQRSNQERFARSRLTERRQHDSRPTIWWGRSRVRMDSQDPARPSDVIPGRTTKAELMNIADTFARRWDYRY